MGSNRNPLSQGNPLFIFFLFCFVLFLFDFLFFASSSASQSWPQSWIGTRKASQEKKSGTRNQTVMGSNWNPLSQGNPLFMFFVCFVLFLFFASSSSSAFDVMTVLNPQAGGIFFFFFSFLLLRRTLDGRCLLPSQRWMFSSAPPGCHRACPSVASAQATCPAS